MTYKPAFLSACALILLTLAACTAEVSNPPSSPPTSTRTGAVSNPPSSPPTSTRTGAVSNPPSSPPLATPSLAPPPPAVQTWINHAQKDLAQRLGIATNEIELVSFETKTWPDSSLGCPQPGMRYLQVLKEGYLILLRAGNDLYNYHGSSGTPPFLCQQLALLKPPLTPKVDEFVPPPGSDID